MTVKHNATGYRSRRACRCESCTDDHRKRHAREDAARRAATAANGGVAPVEQHNAATYTNWGCRCRRCTDANTRNRRAWKAAGA